ncbi:hypothetical protein J5N97_003076 [Dioscorea zingiberensis]|uniref:GST N-terminal domain-containing protein n=1 Tax=Dioscorea zingiberensis TaxID=325984 RepID=A0A9D5HPR5_9LILI|nr:hypothetical protein J5N97_003076 [Dioscorea zingiberensis]
MALMLHAGNGNKNAFKALIAAEYSGVNVELVKHSEMGVSNKTPEFLKMNPLGKVPVLETPYGPVFESSTVARYGFLSGTSLDLLRGRNSITGTLTSHSTAPLYGSRPIHGSSVLSESAKGISSNRPLSPNLILKKPQLSATYSISHRIFGAALCTAILVTPVLMKFSVVYDV